MKILDWKDVTVEEVALSPYPLIIDGDRKIVIVMI